MDLSNLRPADGAKHNDNFRRGRGHGSGNGKTAGKGHKGQKLSLIHISAYLGKVIAEKAIEKGIKDVVFDRGGFIYQGKIQALADAAREAGLNF